MNIFIRAKRNYIDFKHADTGHPFSDWCGSRKELQHEFRTDRVRFVSIGITQTENFAGDWCDTKVAANLSYKKAKLEYQRRKRREKQKTAQFEIYGGGFS